MVKLRRAGRRGLRRRRAGGPAAATDEPIDIAIRTDRIGIGESEVAGFGFTGLVSTVEFLGPSVKLVVTGPGDREFTVLLDEEDFLRRPVAVGNAGAAELGRAGRDRARPPELKPHRKGVRDMTNTKKSTGISRRKLLKTGAAAVGVAAGSGIITGFPTVWAQTPITLRQFGTGVSNLNAIADKCKEDLGITLEMTAMDSDAAAQRAVTQPDSYDIADIEYWILKKVYPSRRAAADGCARSSPTTTASCRSSKTAS